MRSKIQLSDSVRDIMTKMSEGNPGALTVLVKLYKEHGDKGIFTMLGMDDMNIRGSQIWLAYKDHCGEDLGKLVEAVQARDSDMVETVNREYGHTGVLAVTGGASWQR
jgi:hypothetical protein